MATNKQQGRSRALRPSAESLEGRQLLAGSVSGMNTAGDHWTLTVLGKGKVQVIKQNDSTGNPAALDSATEIKSIILSGTDPTSTRLVEKVTPAAGSSGKIYFENLTEQPNHSDRTGNNLGVLAINIPDFYLANTDADPARPRRPRPRRRSRSPTGSTRSGSAGRTPPSPSPPAPGSP